MPTYRYRCSECGEQFDLWQSIHDDSLERHPGCGGAVTKVMSPAGIVLKGSGFYRTDSRAAAGKHANDKDKAPAKDGASSGNGSGTDANSKGAKSESAKGEKSSNESKPSTSKSSTSEGSKSQPSKSGSSS